MSVGEGGRSFRLCKINFQILFNQSRGHPYSDLNMGRRISELKKPIGLGKTPSNSLKCVPHAWGQLRTRHLYSCSDWSWTALRAWYHSGVPCVEILFGLLKLKGSFTLYIYIYIYMIAYFSSQLVTMKRARVLTKLQKEENSLAQRKGFRGSCY